MVTLVLDEIMTIIKCGYILMMESNTKKPQKESSKTCEKGPLKSSVCHLILALHVEHNIDHAVTI